MVIHAQVQRISGCSSGTLRSFLELQEQASATPGQHPSQLSGDLLSLGGDTSTPAVQQLTGQLDASHPFGTQTATVAKKEENWASFD